MGIEKVCATSQMLSKLGITQDMFRGRNLTRHEEAISLEIADIGDDGREHFMVPSAANAWRLLKKTAQIDGESIFIISAFRSVSRQIEIIRGELNEGKPIEEIITECAPPGYSEHHTGRAVDISTHGVQVLERDLEETTAFIWMCQNAKHFGFILSYPRNNPAGYKYEPWHWYFSGIE